MDRPRQSKTSRRRTSTRRQRDPFDGPAEIVLVLLVFTSVLALGSVPFWAMWASAGLALAGGVIGAAALPRPPRPVWVLLALGLFSAVQALPLPFGWLAVLSPTAAETWSRSHLPFGSGAPHFASISLDPGASLAEALKWTSYASTFLLAARVRGQRGSSWLAALVFSAGTGVALLTLLHGAIGVHAVYGVYHPTFDVARWSVGPLLNSNNFAGYVSVSLFAGVALLLSDRSPVHPWLVAPGLIVSVCAVLLSGSRGAGVAALIGAAVLTLALWRAGRFPLRLGPALRYLAPVVAGLLLAVAIGSTRNLDALTTANVSRKVATWKWSLGLLRDHLWLGVGRGAFETALPPYRQPLAQDWSASFSHAENFVVQWLVDWGVLVGGAAVIAVVTYCVWTWWKARSVPHRFALLTGVLVLLLQNLVDLGLEFPSLCILALVALVGGGDSIALKIPRERRFGRAGSGLVSVPLVGAWLTCALFAHFPVGSERTELSDRYKGLDLANSAARAEFRTALASAIRRHPGEPYFPLLGALVAYRARDENPMPWISRALERSPTSGPVHLTLGEMVARRGGFAQAMLHFKLAVEYDSTLMQRAGRRAAALAPSITVLLEAIPAGLRGDNMLLAACDAVPTSSLQLECFRKGVSRAPQDVAMLKRYIDVLFASLIGDSDDCADELARACTDELEQAIQQLAKLMPNEWQPSYYRAKLLSFRGQHREAAQLLSQTCPPGAGGNPCLRDFVLAALAAGSDELRNQALEAYSARECGSSGACAGANDWLAGELVKADNYQLALLHASRAAESVPNAGRWLRVAELALQARRYSDARTAIAHSELAPDATPQTRARGEALGARILSASFSALKPGRR